MNLVRHFQTKYNAITCIIPRILSAKVSHIKNAASNTINFCTLTRIIPADGILQPQKLLVVPSCGLKIKGKMRLRCKDCYFVRREGRMYVMCGSFPRHKQTHLVPKEKYTWIFSHACQSKQRPY